MEPLVRNSRLSGVSGVAVRVPSATGGPLLFSVGGPARASRSRTWFLLSPMRRAPVTLSLVRPQKTSVTHSWPFVTRMWIQAYLTHAKLNGAPITANFPALSLCRASMGCFGFVRWWRSATRYRCAFARERYGDIPYRAFGLSAVISLALPKNDNPRFIMGTIRAMLSGIQASQCGAKYKRISTDHGCL